MNTCDLDYSCFTQLPANPSADNARGTLPQQLLATCAASHFLQPQPLPHITVLAAPIPKVHTKCAILHTTWKVTSCQHIPPVCRCTTSTVPARSSTHQPMHSAIQFTSPCTALLNSPAHVLQCSIYQPMHCTAQFNSPCTLLLHSPQQHAACFQLCCNLIHDQSSFHFTPIRFVMHCKTDWQPA